MFDFNDFDETIRGPWEWDVKRMAASLVLAGEESGHTRPECKAAVRVFTIQYCRSVAEFSRTPILAVARHQIHRARRVHPVHVALRQSERARPMDLLNKLAGPDQHQQFRFRDLKPNSWRVKGEEAKTVLTSIPFYRKNLAPERRHLFDLFHVGDVGFKVSGTGSVGLRNYVLLCEGNGPRDPMFLQIKQEMPSAYAKILPRAKYLHQGRRAADGQRAIQPISDLLLGWTTIGQHQYLVRQLNDHKGSVDVGQLAGSGLKSLALVAGELMARGHARSGDACEITGYCGSGERLSKAIAEFACQYADQTDADYGAFLAAIKSGTINAVAPLH